MISFLRKIENFICEHCGQETQGTGYTNHCSKCLYSKHVDINPGDRASDCGGLMKPVQVELDHGEYVIVHKCKKCGYKKRNKTSLEDNMDLIIQLSVQK